jgi:uncharacterized membrane protein (UPF0127 family)
MRACRAVVPVNGRIVMDRVTLALTTWARFRGLMFRKGLPADEGLLIPHCRSVHTCFMRFPIDLVYLADESRIAKIVEAVKPYRVSSCLKADTVLEVRAGWAREAGLSVGDVLRFEPLEVED